LRRGLQKDALDLAAIFNMHISASSHEDRRQGGQYPYEEFLQSA
jgi:hypothetical protein